MLYLMACIEHGLHESIHHGEPFATTYIHWVTFVPMLTQVRWTLLYVICTLARDSAPFCEVSNAFKGLAYDIMWAYVSNLKSTIYSRFFYICSSETESKNWTRAPSLMVPSPLLALAMPMVGTFIQRCQGQHYWFEWQVPSDPWLPLH